MVDKPDAKGKPKKGKESKKGEESKKNTTRRTISSFFSKNKGSDLEKGLLGTYSEKKSNFPCCFYMPLDIAMEGFALMDITYYSCYALLWAIFLALEPFAGKDEKLALENLNNNTNPNIHNEVNKARLQTLGEAALQELLTRSRSGSRHKYEDEEVLDLDSFKETTTTLASIQHESIDKMNEARLYSRIARRFHIYSQEIDDGCGRNYYAEYLYSYQLVVTKQLFEEVAKKVIYASLLYAVIGCILLTTICCFRGYIASKVLIIFLWYMQLVPNYLILRTAVMSQSQRFCILEYGIDRNVRGQRVLVWSLLWPLVSYKPYQSFIWANYIRRYFKNKEGKLFDESYFSAAKLEERTQKLFQTIPLISSGFNHHRRPIGRAKLFQHPQKHQGLEKSTKTDLVKNSSSD